MSRSPKPAHPQIGMRAMFWSWMTIIVVGLAIMIILPLAGR